MYGISNSFTAPGKHILKLFITALLLLSGRQNLLAQRFNFTQFNIEDGLIQSQARAFAQSPSHHLWIGTQGGVSRFDGSQFYSFTRSDNGLADMSITSLLVNSTGQIYIGTTNGLSIYDGKQIHNFRLPETSEHSWIQNLLRDKSERIYALINGKLYLFSGSSFNQINFSGSAENIITAVNTDNNGKIYAAVSGRGIFELENNKWTLKFKFNKFQSSLKVRQLYFDQFRKNRLWVLTPAQIFTNDHNNLVPYKNSLLDSGNNFLLCLEQDYQSNLWVGTTSGAFYIEPRKTTFFNSGNGFTDNGVNQIFSDSENNIWFATEGAGIYKYDGDKTTVLDKFQGLSNEVVMGFTRDREGSLWMQSFGSALFKMKGGKIEEVKLPIPDTVPYRISHLFTDKDQTLWIATAGAGLLKYDNNRFTSYGYQPDKIPKVIGYILQDRHGTIWLATPTGCYLFANGKFSHLKTFKEQARGLLEIGRDSILISSEKGIYLMTGADHQVELIRKKELENADIYCMLKHADQVYYGTGEDGIWVWDLKKNSYKNITTKDGLYSNTIYGLIADPQGDIWAGTGRGINKFKNVAGGKIKVSGAEYSNRLVLECNQNAMYLYGNKLWVGTTKGALAFDLASGAGRKEKPHIVLQNVKWYSSDVKQGKEYYSKEDGSRRFRDLVLHYRKNHININFKGIYLTNPSEVMYQYRLLGLEDDTFSNPTTNSSVNYQTLPPGNYIFEARALNRAGVLSDNTLRFPFRIQPAFYQTTLFRLAVILLLVLSGITLQTYLHKHEMDRLRQIENLKREERLKARQQTAEDFHDDLGNKLTRISILTDILNTRLNGEHLEEKQLIYQIKENASSLYRGTKDILWALDPKSDNLYEILCHVSEFGIELLQDTAIDFSFEGITPKLSDIRFPMEYSRNVSMIFKESLNNALRHGHPSRVKLKVAEADESIEISLADDGKGFDVQHAHRGLGLNNIYMRAKRIGAMLDISSMAGKGTTITLTLNKPAL